MATKSYQPFTLTDNWFEERAPPLKGVMADYGHRSISTSYSEDFPEKRDAGSSRAQRMAKLTMSKSGALLMTQEDSYDAATETRECRRTQQDFKCVLPSEQGERSVGSSTTYRETFGKREGMQGEDNDRMRTTQFLMLKQADAPWARGRAGARKENGRASSGLIGEVFKESGDPEKDTATQRAWLYDEDIAIRIKRDGQPIVENVEPTTLPGLGEKSIEPYDPEKNFKRVAGITQFYEPIPKAGSRVFMDA